MPAKSTVREKMQNCSFYKVQTNRIRSNEINPSQQQTSVQSIQIPWCAHKHSPAPLKIVTSVIGGANILGCGGSLENCPLSHEKLADI